MKNFKSRSSEARKQARENFHITYPGELPISAKIDELRELWRNNQLIIVCGATGSGKTTQLPKVALELGCGIKGRIGCTQPRRIAATAMARRLAVELGCEYGEGVGSQVRFDDRTQESTVLKFMTDGILLAEFRNDPLLRRYDAVIVDEAHERTLNIDFLLGLLKNLLPLRPDLRVAVSSATLDAGHFSKFFSDAPVLEVEGRTYPVEDIFQIPETDEELPEQVARAVELLSSFDPRGDILAFLPGEREIRDCTEMLTGRGYPNTEVLPLYARLAAGDQQKVFRCGRKRRIVLSTNVAETSLTIPGIKFCIDSGLARVSRYNPRTRIQELQLEMISQASARQRRGRCGRTSDGICVHLYSEDDLNRADQYTDPELKRSSLAGVILQMAALGLPDISVFPFIDPPRTQLIREGVRTLKDIKALDGRGNITETGRRLADLPLDPHLGKMLLTSEKLKVSDALLVLTAGLSAGDVRERPAEKTQAADEAHRRWKDERSDFIGILKLWNDLAVCDSNGILRKFCQRNFINFRRAREWRNLVADLAYEIEFGKNVGKIDLESYEQIHEAILSGIPRNIAHYDPTEKIYRGTDGKKFFLFPGSGLVNKKKRLPEWVVCFHLVETSRVFGRTAAEIDPAVLERCAGHLCARIYDREHYESSSGFVRAREKLTLGGLVVHAGKQVDFGRCNPAAAREIFIREGILTGLVELPSTAVEKFNSVRNDLLSLELKMRRAGTLYDEVAAERLFLQSLPPEVNSVRSLKEFLKNSPGALNISQDELMLEQFIKFDPEDYPDALDFNGVKFKLEYVFEPGAEYDGVTLMVPETMINVLPENILDYPVAGYYAEFGEALMRSLPKELRRKIGGIPDAARRFADYLKNDPSAKNLPAGGALAEFMLYDAETDVDPALFKMDKLPVYLKMHLGILNSSGCLKERVDELPGRIYRSSRLSSSVPGAGKHISAELNDWQDTGETIPESVEVPPGSGRLSYPGLSVGKNGVSRQLFLYLSEAKRQHRKGVMELFILKNNQQEKFLKRGLKFSNELHLSLMLGYEKGKFEEEVMRAALLSAAETDLWEVRSAVDFQAVSEKMRMQWADELDGLCEKLEKYASDYSSVRALAKRAGSAGDDIKEHLEFLFAPGFLRRGNAVTEDYPRYLRALKVRAERAVNSPAKDLQKGEVLESYWQSFRTAATTLDDLTGSDGLYEFWQLLEECRIAVFAPEVKCAIRSPLAKLETAWDKLRI